MTLRLVNLPRASEWLVETLVYRLDITLVTVTSVLFRIAKASATGFGSEICGCIIQIEHAFFQVNN
jgi:uncharacterized membrane protein YccF (DUF307 family)